MLQVRENEIPLRKCAGGTSQARNQGGEAPPGRFFAILEKCVGYILKLLDLA